MNRIQTSRLETTLLLLNRSVLELDRLLELSELDEPMFHSKSPFSAEKKGSIRARLAELRQMIARLALDHGIEKREEEMLSRVRGEFNSHWVMIEDTKCKEMSRYGEIAPELKDTLDPELDRLASGVLSLLDSLRIESR
jgi:hypothetical protein